MCSETYWFVTRTSNVEKTGEWSDVTISVGQPYEVCVSGCDGYDRQSTRSQYDGALTLTLSPFFFSYAYRSRVPRSYLK